MSVGIAALTELVKKHIRISAENTTTDDETSGLVESAIADMKMRGVDADRLCPAGAEVSGMSPLAVRAVVYYCKSNFGVSSNDTEAERYWSRYEGITQSMSHTSDYMPIPDEGSE